MRHHRALLLLWPLALVVAPAGAAEKPIATEACDVVVYGGTPAGLGAAIVAARQGASVVVIEPSRWIGGMVTGGLSATDKGKEETIGGFAREFFTRAAASKPGTPLWYAEPHVNMATFQAMLKEAGVSVITEQRLAAVDVRERRIVGLTTAAGVTYRGKVFIDASYEGDLMAAAGVSYIVGRESREQYGEPLAGYYPMPIRAHGEDVMESHCADLGGDGPHYVHGTPAAISGLDERGEPIFGVVRAPDLQPGDADGLTQAYNFRLCVTQRADNRVPFPKPANYQPERYQLLLRLIEKYPGIRFGRLFHLKTLAGEKFDLNAQGLFSTDYPGGNTEYPDGDAATRERIYQDHVDFIQGMLWLLCHDERVPARLRAEANSWGLCRDEFVDNDHWPHALYVREARRMVGAYVMTQKDVQDEIIKPDSVAMGSFVIDCHIVQRILAEDGTVRDEGSFSDSPSLPYQIPYRSITPKAEECENLLAPVCLSASHVACCTLRMEPVYMALGHASGLAAVMAADSDGSVQQVDIKQLHRRLLEQQAVLELASIANMVRSAALPGVVMDQNDAERVGVWRGSAYGATVNGSSLHDDNSGQGEKRVIYRLQPPAAGRYEVRMSYAFAPNRASNVPVTVEHEDGRETVLVNQKRKPPIDGLFLSLGEFNFSPQRPAVITISNEGADGYVSADALQLLEAK